MDNFAKNLTQLYGELADLKYDFRNKNLIELLGKLVEGENILEIGCGNGLLLERLRRLGKNVTGLEPNANLVEISKKMNPDLRVINSSAEEIENYIDGKFNSILMVDVLEHIEDDVKIAGKVKNYLEDGGVFLIVVPAHPILYGARDKSIGHYRRYSKKALVEALNKNNFEVETIRHWNMAGFFPYFLYEKILCKPLGAQFRTKEKSFFRRAVAKLLDFWFKYVENNIDFGFGLSLICAARKK